MTDPGGADGRRPVLMAVDGNADALGRVGDELERRHGTDYRVLRDAGAPLALLLADRHPRAGGSQRRRSVKRVASAVGEGSGAVSQVHRYLAEAETPSTA